MKWALAAALLFAGCGNYGNVYLPPGERKPLLGPDPKHFANSVEVNRAVQSLKLRLNAPPNTPLKLRVGCEGDSGLMVRLNARSMPSGLCPYSANVPVGTIVPGAAALVDLKFSSPALVKRVSLEP